MRATTKSFPRLLVVMTINFYTYLRGNPINQKLGYFLSRVSMLYYDHVCGTNRLSLREKWTCVRSHWILASTQSILQAGMGKFPCHFQSLIAQMQHLYLYYEATDLSSFRIYSGKLNRINIKRNKRRCCVREVQSLDIS